MQEKELDEILKDNALKDAQLASFKALGFKINISWGKFTFPPINLLNSPYVDFERLKKQ